MRFMIYDAAARAGAMALNGGGVAVNPVLIGNPAHADVGKWAAIYAVAEGEWERWADIWAGLPTYEGEPDDLFLPTIEVT